MNIMQVVAGAASEAFLFSAALWCGSRWNGTFFIYRSIHTRYEFDIPEGATIFGVALDYTVASGSVPATGTIKFSGGFMIRQSGVDSWTNDDALLNWDLQTKFIFGEANTPFGVLKTHANFFGGSPAFEDLVCNKKTAILSSYQIGSGTLNDKAEGNDAGGMTAQLQDYLDDSATETSRGVDTALGSDYFSVLFTLYRSYDHASPSQNFQALRSADDTNNAFQPYIIVEWGLAPVVTMTLPFVPFVNAPNPITFAATSISAEHGDLSSGVVWTSSLDGAMGTGASIDFVLSIGVHTVTCTSTDSDGLTSFDTKTITVQDPFPVVTILTPANGLTVMEREPILFSATALDFPDGDLTSSLVWSYYDSRNDPVYTVFGSGSPFSAVIPFMPLVEVEPDPPPPGGIIPGRLPPVPISIVAQVTDSAGGISGGSADITILAYPSEGEAELVVEGAASATLDAEAAASSELVVEEAATGDLQIENETDAELDVENEGGE
jgi:hypothetical protein